MSETKLDRAKRISMLKWIRIKQKTTDLIDLAANGERCGFCQEWESCADCQGRTECRDMEKWFINFVECALDYLENDLIPYLSPPETEEGEKEQ